MTDVAEIFRAKPVGTFMVNTLSKAELLDALIECVCLTTSQ